MPHFPIVFPWFSSKKSASLPGRRGVAAQPPAAPLAPLPRTCARSTWWHQADSLVIDMFYKPYGGFHNGNG